MGTSETALRDRTYGGTAPGETAPGGPAPDCAVVIPVYKEDVSADEEKSLRQCLKVLGGRYAVIFAAPRGLDCGRYEQICSGRRPPASVSYEFFKGKFFSGFNGYNALLFCRGFYERFLDYRYILIYQPDAFIFEDGLAFWIGRGYDYVGGPYFDLQRGARAPKRTDYLNGGFSLRKTEFFYRIAKTRSRANVFRYLLLLRYEKLLKKQASLNPLQKMLLLWFGGIKYFCKLLKWELGEDWEWSAYVKKHGKIAPFDEALRFSFDSCPEYAFELNGRSLPLGCHGWTAYYNRLFWDKYI
jgi:hypothetical protein